MTRMSVADIGTNTIKILHADASADGEIAEIERDTSTVRLGFELEITGHIAQDRMERAIVFLQRSERRGRELGSDVFVGVATDAVRVADNGHELLERIKQSTAWDVSVLDGDTEARFAFLGLRHLLPDSGNAMVVDIGGGSTELISVVDGELKSQISVPIGSGRLADRHLDTDPPSADAIDACVRAASDELPDDEQYMRNVDVAIFSGGNGEFLSTIAEAETGSRSLDSGQLDIVREWLLSHPASQTATLAGISHERALVLPAGLAVAIAVMERVHASSARSAPSGLQRGVILNRQLQSS